MNQTYREALINFFSGYKTKKYKKGELVIRAGDEIRGIGMLKSGFVRVYVEKNDGNEMTLPVLRPFFYSTLAAAVVYDRNLYNMEAISPVELWMAPKGEAMDFFTKNKDLYAHVMQEIMAGLTDLTFNMAKILSGDAYERVATTLHMLFTNFCELDEGSKHADLPIPHRLIASMCGLSRETVTLQILKLAKKGLISTKNRRISLINEEKLKAVTG